MQTWAGGSTGKAENALTKGPIDNVDYNITLMWVIQDQELSAGVYPSGVRGNRGVHAGACSCRSTRSWYKYSRKFWEHVILLYIFFQLRHDNWSSSELTMQGWVLHSPSDKIRITSILVGCRCMLLAQCIACRTGNRVQREIKTYAKKE